MPMFLSPAITPWESTIRGLGAVNPSIRLYRYCRDTGLIRDYEQYYVNLRKANKQSYATWELEYSLTTAYDVKDASGESLRQIVENFDADMKFSPLKSQYFSRSATFDKYFQYNSVSQDRKSECKDKCVNQHICAMLYVDYDQYDECRYQRNYNTEKMQTWRDSFINGKYANSVVPHAQIPNNSALRNSLIPTQVFYIIASLCVCICLMVGAVVYVWLSKTDKRQEEECRRLLHEEV